MNVSTGSFLLLPLVLSASCTGRSTRQAAQSRAPAAALPTLGALDPTETYRRAGFLTMSGPVSFIGNVRFLAGPSPDSVLVIVAVSLPSRSLTFTREGERYRATYEVEFNLLQKAEGTARLVGRFSARETVRVSSLRETTRDEESVIFQQFVVVPPGSYTAALTVRDLGSNRTGSAEVSVVAPYFSSTRGNRAGREASIGSTRVIGLASPVTVHTATPRASRTIVPDLVLSARSTAIFGRDSVMRIYFEWYDAGAAVPTGPTPHVQFSIRAEDGRELLTDSIGAEAWGADGQIAAAIARVPVAKVGLGRLRITAWRLGGTDSVSAPVFISPVDDLAAVSFEELLGYLRYFATTGRLRILSDTLPEARAGAWAAFLRATDPSPTTPEHEGLREYFSRLAAANTRFRGEDVPGWLTDRGMVYSTLGEPDGIVEPRLGERRTRSRTQTWGYTHHRLQLVFVEQQDLQRWRLAPSSEVEFQAVAERVKR